MKSAFFFPFSGSSRTCIAKRRLSGMACAMGIPLAAPLAHGAAIANFTGGNGNTLVDQWQGAAGDGWSTAWGTNTDLTAAGTTFNSTVTDTNPLNGGGNYLSTTLTGIGSGNNKGAVWRRYDNTAVDLTLPYTVSFSMRLDSSLSDFTATSDYLQAFDRGASGASSDFGNPGTWLIRAAGASVNGIEAHNWMLYDGNKAGTFNTAFFVDSGVSLVTGAVYDFVIAIDPALFEYRVSINGGAFSDALGFRSSVAPGTVHFGGQLTGASAENPKSYTFSLDSVAVIPEPSVAALTLPVLLGLCARRRRV